MKKFYLAAMVSAVSLTACATLSAFGSADANGDGRISRDEAVKSTDLTDVFSSADADQDGYLNSAEYDWARDRIQGLKDPQHDAPASRGHRH